MTIENKPAQTTLLSKAQLAQLEPIAKLSANRLNELAEVCIVERVSKDLDPTRLGQSHIQSLYLISGDLGIRYTDGKKVVLRGGTPAARFPLDSARLAIQDTIALTPLEITRIDLDLIDIMMTWDQLSGQGSASGALSRDQAEVKAQSPTLTLDATTFNAFKLQNGVFSKLPAANIETMLSRLTLIEVEAGQTIITQGQEGDYYYLIQAGTAVVSRVRDTSQAPVMLAEIGHGAAFGEEALVSDTKRNATVTMKTKGQLLRLKKQDFVELLKAPIVQYVNQAEAEQKIAQGAQLLDVRFESEYAHQHPAGAVNAPLHELRNIVASLDQSKEYILYCQTGRRSSAAAFILAQFGFSAFVLH